ncbi:C40 family peptidase [Marinobacterium weihaiense]|uniref:C40 family peptidase n=1 Tax=Marinobacterium weihaiense TaxID=2851016 RepID=A0ABS6M8I5_9GAMM|nr:NlpC/P60 family protein [Marinobacterium weihaiense]MBV0932601.1 C40 family peptidase [Marinobacterium weihaiense]
MFVYFNKGRALLLLGLMLLAGCSSTSSTRYAPAAVDDPVRNRLLISYSQWAGTPYRYGGDDRRGVDCSGFIQQVYRQLDGRQLPRTTEAQARLGDRVARDRLRPADLVFFRTGWKQRHAGIYLGGGEFMHASTSRGVMISRLDNPYWEGSWWMARRLPADR